MITIIIEFIGVPGSGKSTVAKELLNQFLCTGVKAVDSWSILQFNEQSRFVRLVIKLRLLNLKETFNWFRLALCVKHPIDKQQLRRIMYAERICMSYRAVNSSKSICVADQGLLQAVVSIIHMYEVRNWEKVIRITNNIMSNYEIIVIESSIASELALERIRSRAFDYGSRLNYIREDETLLQNISIQNGIIRKIGALVDKPNIQIDMIKPAWENAQVIIKEMKVFLK